MANLFEGVSFKGKGNIGSSKPVTPTGGGGSWGAELKDDTPGIVESFAPVGIGKMKSAIGQWKYGDKIGAAKEGMRGLGTTAAELYSLPFRFVARTSGSIALSATGQKGFAPTTPQEQFFYGKENVKPMGQMMGEGYSGGTQLGAGLGMGKTGQQILGGAGMGLVASMSAADFTGSPLGKMGKQAAKKTIQQGAKGLAEKEGVGQIKSIFQGLPNLTTKIVEKLKGKAVVSKQFISDITNSGDVKQAERDIIRQVLETEGDKVDVNQFAKKVQDELLPLEIVDREPSGGGGTRNIGVYENIVLPDEVRGEVDNYGERIYKSPIETSAGSVHFKGSPGAENYFGHTRVEEMAPSYIPGKRVERTIETQTDLYQKGRLEGEADGFDRLREAKYHEEAGNVETAKRIRDEVQAREKEVARLEQYNDPTAHFRIVREDIADAARRGVDIKLFPTGETAMKVEGLGNEDIWHPYSARMYDPNAERLTQDGLFVGRHVVRGTGNDTWVITDVLGDGKFKAMPKEHFDSFAESKGLSVTGEDLVVYAEHHATKNFWGSQETFDISGKVDTENPIYNFYEKTLGKYLKNRYGAEIFTDANGVSWWKIDIKPEHKGPVEAFGLAAGFEPETDEEGRVTGLGFDPTKAAMGLAGMSVAKKFKLPTRLPSDVEERTLMAVHNTTAGKLGFSQEIGGIPNPSLAIVDLKKGMLEGFGDITLIADKNLVEQGKTHVSDIYSPRTPSTNYKFKGDRLNKLLNTLKPYEEKSGSSIYDIDSSDIGRSLENSALTMAKFLDEKGVALPADKWGIKDLVRNDEKLLQEYTDYWQNLIKEHGGERVFFAGRTAMGRPRYIPATAENASKIMNKEATKGGEGFFYGAGSIRAKLSKKLDSILSIRSAKDKIVSETDFKPMKEELNNELAELISSIEKKYPDSYLRMEEVLSDYIGGDKGWLKQQNLLDTEDFSRLDAFKQKLKDAKTSYFETKFKRPVDVGEFQVAVIPDDTSAKAVEELKSKGLKIEFYKAGNEADRLAAVARSQDTLAFGVVAGAEVETDEQGKVTGMGFSPTKMMMGMAGTAAVKKFGLPARMASKNTGVGTKQIIKNLDKLPKEEAISAIRSLYQGAGNQWSNLFKKEPESVSKIANVIHDLWKKGDFKLEQPRTDDQIMLNSALESLFQEGLILKNHASAKPALDWVKAGILPGHTSYAVSKLGTFSDNFGKVMFMVDPDVLPTKGGLEPGTPGLYSWLGDIHSPKFNSNTERFSQVLPRKTQEAIQELVGGEIELLGRKLETAKDTALALNEYSSRIYSKLDSLDAETERGLQGKAKEFFTMAHALSDDSLGLKISDFESAVSLVKSLAKDKRYKDIKRWGKDISGHVSLLENILEEAKKLIPGKDKGSMPLAERMKYPLYERMREIGHIIMAKENPQRQKTLKDIIRALDKSGKDVFINKASATDDNISYAIENLFDSSDFSIDPSRATANILPQDQFSTAGRMVRGEYGYYDVKDMALRPFRFVEGKSGLQKSRSRIGDGRYYEIDRNKATKNLSKILGVDIRPNIDSGYGRGYGRIRLDEQAENLLNLVGSSPTAQEAIDFIDDYSKEISWEGDNVYTMVKENINPAVPQKPEFIAELEYAGDTIKKFKEMTEQIKNLLRSEKGFKQLKKIVDKSQEHKDWAVPYAETKAFHKPISMDKMTMFVPDYHGDAPYDIKNLVDEAKKKGIKVDTYKLSWDEGEFGNIKKESYMKLLPYAFGFTGAVGLSSYSLPARLSSSGNVSE